MSLLSHSEGVRILSGPDIALPKSVDCRAYFMASWLHGSIRQRLTLGRTGRPAARFRHADEGTGTPYAAKRHSLLSPALIGLGLIPILTFALGTWQVQRLKWKVDLIDKLSEKLQQEPIPLPRKVK